MKKTLIIPILLMLLTACASVEAPTVQTEETPAISTVETTIKEGNTDDGWLRLVNSESVITGYKGKEVSLTGKVVETEIFGTWKYFFKVSETNFENLPSELVEKFQKKPSLGYYTLYFEDKDVTDNYKNKEITVTTESIGIFSEGMPRLYLKKLP
ncbi:alkaline phosphatase family protein [Candidatus Gracilibacteria bacterium]|nr:alkaline phosphatase family protein [Candidatus Gracilibacteria bacterium]